jgi:hypothetical protein
LDATGAAELTERRVECGAGDARLGSGGAEIDDSQVVVAQRIELARASEEARRNRVRQHIRGLLLAAFSHDTSLLRGIR